MAEVTIGVSNAIDGSRRSQELPQSKNVAAFSLQQAGILKIGRNGPEVDENQSPWFVWSGKASRRGWPEI